MIVSIDDLRLAAKRRLPRFVFDYIEGDATIWEQEPMQKRSTEGMLAAYRHNGYWQNMDTLRDMEVLEEQWRSGNPPWKVW